MQGARLRDESRDPFSVADVKLVVDEAFGRAPQSLEVPRRVPVGTEELPAHVVVDAVYRVAPGVEELDHLRTDQPA